MAEEVVDRAPLRATPLRANAIFPLSKSSLHLFEAPKQRSPCEFGTPSSCNLFCAPFTASDRTGFFCRRLILPRRHERASFRHREREVLPRSLTSVLDPLASSGEIGRQRERRETAVTSAVAPHGHPRLIACNWIPRREALPLLWRFIG